jgi:hypothetical protein
LPDVRRADARSAKIDLPEGVTRRFHVSLNKVDPRKSRLCCNLLSNNSDRLALADEVVCSWP